MAASVYMIDTPDIPEAVYLLTKSQIKYLRELIGISFGIGMTEEVSLGLDLINRVLKERRYDEWDKEELNKLSEIFKYKQNKNKHFL